MLDADVQAEDATAGSYPSVSITSQKPARFMYASTMQQTPVSCSKLRYH